MSEHQKFYFENRKKTAFNCTKVTHVHGILPLQRDCGLI